MIHSTLCLYPDLHLLPSSHSGFGFLLFLEYAKDTLIHGPCAHIFLCLESSPSRYLSNSLLQITQLLPNKFMCTIPINLYSPGPALFF